MSHSQNVIVYVLASHPQSYVTADDTPELGIVGSSSWGFFTLPPPLSILLLSCCDEKNLKVVFTASIMYILSPFSGWKVYVDLDLGSVQGPFQARLEEVDRNGNSAVE